MDDDVREFQDFAISYLIWEYLMMSDEGPCLDRSYINDKARKNCLVLHYEQVSYCE